MSRLAPRIVALEDLPPACPLCGANRTLPKFKAGGHCYWTCADCGLIFARSSANANFRQSIDDYEASYRQYLDEEPNSEANLDDVIAWIESHVSLGNSKVRLLDVGAGSGRFVRRIRRIRPCVVSGIEPSMALYKTYDLASLGIEAVTLPELAGSQTARFDVVTVLDVIEHVPEAAEFVSALARVTRPGGFVFLSTPDAHGVVPRLLGRRWHHYNAYHFSLYCIRALAEAARRGGFRIVASGHRSKYMSLGYLWSRAMDFQLKGGRTTKGRFLSRLAIPVNLGDILSVVWQRTEIEQP